MSLFSRVQAECTHVPVSSAEPRGESCEACGSTRNLRMCAECGYVACCESQAGHNRIHARDSGHPVIKQLPLGPRSFTWCYECDRYV
jgi:uncharacterized UBP type Zn finger protein